MTPTESGRLHPAPAIKALHVLEPGEAGGVESVVRALVTETVRCGGEVAVAALCQSSAPVPFVGSLRMAGVDVEEIRCGRRHYFAEARALESTIRHTRAQVVHTHVDHADFVGYRAARDAGRPVVTTVHGFTGTGWKGRLYDWLDVRILRRFDAVLCVSEPLRTRILGSGVPNQRVHLVPNGHVGDEVLSRAEARASLGIDRGDRVVGWVGRLSYEKGPDLLVASTLPLPGNVRVTLVGDGPDQGRVQAIAAAHPRVQLLGFRPNAGRLLRAFDVLVISSRTEGLPIVLLEAMAAEVPVVSFAVGGVPEVVGHDSAWLVPPGDTEALARAIEEALEAPEEARRRAARARLILDERFSGTRWLDRVQAIYRGVVKQPTGSTA